MCWCLSVVIVTLAFIVVCVSGMLVITIVVSALFVGVSLVVMRCMAVVVLLCCGCCCCCCFVVVVLLMLLLLLLVLALLSL